MAIKPWWCCCTNLACGDSCPSENQCCSCCNSRAYMVCIYNKTGDAAVLNKDGSGWTLTLESECYYKYEEADNVKLELWLGQKVSGSCPDPVQVGGLGKCFTLQTYYWSGGAWVLEDDIDGELGADTCCYSDVDHQIKPIYRWWKGIKRVILHGLPEPSSDGSCSGAGGCDGSSYTGECVDATFPERPLGTCPNDDSGLQDPHALWYLLNGVYDLSSGDYLSDWYYAGQLGSDYTGCEAGGYTERYKKFVRISGSACSRTLEAGITERRFCSGGSWIPHPSGTEFVYFSADINYCADGEYENEQPAANYHNCITRCTCNDPAGCSAGNPYQCTRYDMGAECGTLGTVSGGSATVTME